MKYWLFRVAAAATGIVPRRLAFAIAVGLAHGYARFKKHEATVVAANLQRIAAFRGEPLAPAEALRRVTRVFESFAKTVVDYYYFANRPEELAALMEVENFDALIRAKAAGKGTVVVTAHLGCVENGGATVVRKGLKFNVVALSQPDDRLDALFQQQRTARGMQVLPVGRATRECLRVLQRNEIVALLGDRDFTPNRDVAMFFGAPARLPTGPVRLAWSTGAPIVTAFCVRRPDDGYKLFFHDPIFPDKTKDSAEEIGRRVIANLEKAIGDHAEQWHIFHNSWDPDKDLALSQAYVQRG